MDTKLTNIKDLNNFLTHISDSCGDNNQLAFSVKSQLSVISSIGSIELATYSINEIMDMLRTNIDNTPTEKEKNFYQIQAADMIQSIFFFAKAKISLLEEENRKTTNELIDQASNFLLKGLNFVINTCKDSFLSATGSTNLPVSIASSLKTSIVNKLKGSVNINTEGTKSFLGKIRAKKEINRQIDELYDDFEELKRSFKRKAIDYRELFGNSIIFKELIEEVFEIEPIIKNEKTFLLKYLFFDIFAFLFYLMLSKSFPTIQQPLLIMIIIITVLQALLIIAPIVLYFVSKNKQNETSQKLRDFKNNKCSGIDFLTIENKYDGCVNAYYNFEPVNNVIGRILLGIGILALGVGLSIFLWALNGNSVAMIFAKIGSIIIGLITLIAEIIYIKIDVLNN